MIASIRGEVLSSGAGWVILGVGGIGFRLEVPARSVSVAPGDHVDLHTHLVVREDSLTLFGFSSADELEVFGILLGVSGVGPRSALGILSELSPAQIASAAASEDERPFRKVSGIGPKTAKLLAVQLGGKLDPRMFQEGDALAHSVTSAVSDTRVGAKVAAALTGLGYSEDQAVSAVKDALDAEAPSDEPGLLRAALLLLQSPRMPARNGVR